MTSFNEQIEKSQKSARKAIFFATISVIFAATAVVAGAYRSVMPSDEPAMTCKEASAEVMAMQACLANRPGCIIPNGPAAFKLYHEARRRDLECENESEQRSSQDTRVQEGGG